MLKKKVGFFNWNYEYLVNIYEILFVRIKFSRLIL